MATIKVFDSTGVKQLQCFDTLVEIPYLPVEEDDLAADQDPDAAEE